MQTILILLQKNDMINQTNEIVCYYLNDKYNITCFL